MIIRLIVALILSALTTTIAIAEDIYRWTDPESGKVLVAPKPPSYPIKEQRTAGRLPNGNMIELILDTNAPEVKALIEKRRVREAEQKRIVEEAARQREIREAEAAKERDIKEAEAAKEREIREAEAARQRAAKEAEEKRIAEKQAKEKAAHELALQRKIAQAKSSKEDDVQFMISIIDEFMQYDKFASSTARIALALPINNLLSTRMKLNSHSVASCYKESKDILLNYMDLTIKSYYAFSAKEESISIEYKQTANKALESFFLNLPDSCSWFKP